MFVSFVVMFVGFSGMAFLVGRRLREARLAGTTMDFPFNQLFHSAEFFFRNLWNNFLLPRFFRNAERMVVKTKAKVARLEKTLEKLDDYLRGKHKTSVLKNSGADSQYWNSVIEFKNELNGENKNTPA
jgi:hypothetical protein